MDVYTRKWTDAERYSYLLEMNIANAEEVSLVVGINGYNQKTFEDILYIRTGYRTFESYVEEV